MQQQLHMQILTDWHACSNCLLTLQAAFTVFTAIYATMAGCSFSTTAASVTYKQLAAAMLCCSSDIWAYCLCRSSSAGPVHSIAAINASTTTNSSMHKALYVQTQAGAHADFNCPTNNVPPAPLGIGHKTRCLIECFYWYSCCSRPAHTGHLLVTAALGQDFSPVNHHAGHHALQSESKTRQILHLTVRNRFTLKASGCLCGANGAAQAMLDLKCEGQQSSQQHCNMCSSSKIRGSTTRQTLWQQQSRLFVEEQPHLTAPAPKPQQLRVTFWF